jgi:hypothetical protein
MGRPVLRRTVAASPDRPGIALILFFLVLPVFTFLLGPLFSLHSRRHEFEADAFATRHASARALVQALVKLYEDNAATLTPDPMHSAFYDSHPRGGAHRRHHGCHGVADACHHRAGGARVAVASRGARKPEPGELGLGRTDRPVLTACHTSPARRGRPGSVASRLTPPCPTMKPVLTRRAERKSPLYDRAMTDHRSRRNSPCCPVESQGNALERSFAFRDYYETTPS